MIRSAAGVLGFGAIAGTYNASFSATRNNVPDVFPETADQKPAIPPYNAEARFLDQHQYAVVATLAALIIPTDDEPGATEAGVVDYIDQITADSKKKQGVYSKGLTWLDAFCKSKYGGEFLNIDLRDQMDLLQLAFDHGGSSSFLKRAGSKMIRIWQGLTGTRINGRFLNEVRKDVVDGFYTNPIAWQHVGYFGPPIRVGIWILRNRRHPPTTLIRFAWSTIRHAIPAMKSASIREAASSIIRVRPAIGRTRRGRIKKKPSTWKIISALCFQIQIAKKRN